MMIAVSELLTRFGPEWAGFLGGAVFALSWLLQAWESRSAGSPIVSARFFIMRAVGSALLAYEGIRVGSLSITLIMVGTGLLMLYNLWLARRVHSPNT